MPIFNDARYNNLTTSTSFSVPILQSLTSPGLQGGLAYYPSDPNTVYVHNGSASPPWVAVGGGGGGSVTSVGLSVTGGPVGSSPSGIFSISGSPVTTTGTLNLQVTGANGTVPIFNGSNQLIATGGNNGEILIGNGTGFTVASLMAGAGISIIPGPGSISISSTGGGVTSFSGGTTGLTPPPGPTTGAITLSGTLIAANGGTGFSSYTIGDILYAGTSTTLAQLSDVATGNALISGGVGTAPSWGKINLTTAITGILPIANGGTNSSTALNNDRIMISNGGSIVEAAAGVTNTVLIGNTGAAPSFSATPTVTSITLNGTSNQLTLNTGGPTTIVTSPNTGAARTYTIPDISSTSATGNFALYTGSASPAQVLTCVDPNGEATWQTPSNPLIPSLQNINAIAPAALGSISLTTVTTFITLTGVGSSTTTIAAGTAGQIKNITAISLLVGTTAVLTGAFTDSAGNNHTTFTFENTGNSIQLISDGTRWLNINAGATPS